MQKKFFMDYHDKNDNTLDVNMEVIKPEMERIQEQFRKTAGSRIELGNSKELRKSKII